MAYPVIGQKINIEVKDGSYVGRYSARVQDMEKTKIFIDLPMKLEAKSPTVLPEKMTIMVRYRSIDGAQCSFVTVVLGREKRNIDLLGLHKPKIEDVHRQQRREFLRVPFHLDLDLVYMDSVTKSIITAQARGQDISGGGLSFAIPADLPMQANDIIGFRFRMNLEGKGYDIVGKARVIRIAPPNETGYKAVSLKYFELNETDRQLIVQYSFKRQIEMREKGVLGN
ncbi:flagellar brake protein [Tumebacillus permanentifrigoris]|uniref:C-di-GMP-binding flagellar brake protein YcgR n=1 Tax=Tumebacillus permanentifrigoris TaxID=378543 RepID=A0A316DWS7_9BACL|nr:flagellar brake domain-containing protein [Tumebacillus permanentifrigoris]PWK14294.1 c-di-GMP-binding flagellar brake protein YcgR [Tumebacillus permanentifrigoris]